MGEAAIETRNLTKVFPGDVVAVTGMDMRIERERVYGLIGRNGAGKTTTLRMLMGLLLPSGGDALVLGEDLWEAPREHRQRVGYVSQAQQLHAWMTLGEHCEYAAHFYDCWETDHARAVARRFGVAWNRQIGVMSGGEQRKASIALALAAHPEVLILDEPAAGLDPIARRELIDQLIETLSRNGSTTVLFSTHILSDIERIADSIGIMDRGRLVADAPLDQLQTTSKRVQVIFPGDARPKEIDIPGAIRQEALGPVINAIVRLESDAQLDGIRKLPGVRVETYPLGLEDIMVEFFGPKNGGEDASFEEEEYEHVPLEASARPGGSAWLLIAIVFFVLLALGAFWFMSNSAPSRADVAPSREAPTIHPMETEKGVDR